MKREQKLLPERMLRELATLELFTSPYHESQLQMIRDEIERTRKREEAMRQENARRDAGRRQRNAVIREESSLRIKEISEIYGAGVSTSLNMSHSKGLSARAEALASIRAHKLHGRGNAKGVFPLDEAAAEEGKVAFKRSGSRGELRVGKRRLKSKRTSSVLPSSAFIE